MAWAYLSSDCLQQLRNVCI